MINSDYNTTANYLSNSEIFEKSSNSDKVSKVFIETQNEINSQEITPERIIENENKISNDRMISRVISYLQEIFISLKKDYPKLKEKYPSLIQEYQNFPTFNQWLKKNFDENSFSSTSLIMVLYLNSLVQLDHLKNRPEFKRNNILKNEIFNLSFILLLLLKINSDNLCHVETISEHTLNYLDLISKFNSIDNVTKNNFILMFLFVNKLVLHPELPKILSVLDKITVKNLMSHPSLNIKFAYSLNLIKEQFKSKLEYYFNHTCFLNEVFSEFKKRNIDFKTTTFINDDTNKQEIEKETVFTPLIGCRRIFKELENLSRLLSQPNNSLEISFELLKNIQIINKNFQYFSMLNNRSDLNHPFIHQIFNSIPTLKSYLSVYKNFQNSITSKLIFELMNVTSSNFKLYILDIYSYAFTLQLIEEDKIDNLKFIENHFNEVNKIIRIILNYLSMQSFENHKSYENFNNIIKKNQENIIKYKNELYLNKLNDKKNVFEISIAVQEIIDTYIFLDNIIKDFILIEIKVYMYNLKIEKNEDRIIEIKNYLDMLANTYDLCLNILNQTHKILKLFSEDQFILPTEKLSPIDINSEEIIDHSLIESISQNTIDCKDLEKNEEEILTASEIKNESQNELETKKEIVNEEVEFNDNSLKTEDLLSEPTIFDEYSEYLEETGWKAHMKRRELLQILTQNGWKINASAGKGSHVKAEGPNGTVVIVPHKSTIAKGTNRSIEESFLSDKKKFNETKNKKEVNSISQDKKRTTVKKKNKPKRK